jgi:hypothetical protein
MGRSFSITSKYERVRNLLIAYVWDLRESEATSIYALTYREAFSVAETLGWTKTASWDQGLYTTTRPSARTVELLEPYKMTPEKWWDRVTDIAK